MEAHHKISNGHLRDLDPPSRREFLSGFIHLLRYREDFYQSAAHSSAILGRPALSSSTYNQSEAQLDGILKEAIKEIESGLVDPTSRSSEGCSLWSALRNEPWKVKGSILSTLLVICVGSYALGKNDFFVRLVDLVKTSLTT